MPAVVGTFRQDAHINPAGWDDWSHDCGAGRDGGKYCNANRTCWCENVTYAEYGSIGPGANPSKRVAWSQQFDQAAAGRYTRLTVMRGWTPIF